MPLVEVAHLRCMDGGLQGDDGELEATLQRVRKTRRPSKALLEQLLQEARDLQCCVPEEGSLDQTLMLLEQWRVDSQTFSPSMNDGAANFCYGLVGVGVNGIS